VVDFTGTSGMLANNFNAPSAIVDAAVLYVFRTLVDDDIPLNSGCLEPLDIRTRQGSMLSPNPPAAVVAGNVETSQHLVDALYAALGVMANSLGTMSNFTFGDAEQQYYETICGGAGATNQADGCDAVHSHMTNSRLTDPEILETRFPVVLEDFHIRDNSGGKGRWHAGNGTSRTIRFREAMDCAILSGHRKVAPFGLEGGEPGEIGHNIVRRVSGATEELSGADQTAMAAGDTITIVTTTGGGFGRRQD